MVNGEGRHRAWRDRLRHALGWASHDGTHAIADELSTSRDGVRAIWVSFAGLMVTAAIQLLVVFFSHSAALLSDTLHNFADALTAVPLAVAFVIGRRSENERYTYGYGRAEDLAGLFILAVIALSAVVAGYTAIDRLVHPQEVTYLWAMAGAAIIGFAGNEAVARYRIVVGRRIGSAALVADGLHARTDGLTSLAVLFGAIGVALGWEQADPIVGLVITVMILFVLRDAARSVYHRLMDAVDPQITAACLEVVEAVPGVRGCAHLRVRWVGHGMRAECDIGVDPAIPVSAAHGLAHEVERELVGQIPRLVAATVHVEPAERGDP